MNKCLQWIGIGFTIAVCTIGLSQKASAADYLGWTEEYATMHKGEFELELKFDLGRNRDSNSHYYATEYEMAYGITEHFKIEGEVEIKHTTGEGTEFDEAKLELRYRFLEKGDLPVDIAIAGKLITEGEDEGLEHSVELRLILAKSFGNLNIALNLPVDIPLKEGSAKFLPSLAVGYYVVKSVRIASEVRYDVEDHKGFVMPQIQYRLPTKKDIKVFLGYAHGFDREQRDFGKMGIEIEM